MKKKEKKYDVIIVGSGIGGLICGTYLAKADMKVLIIEKNSKVGGCCTSFARNGYIFNGGAHALGGCRKGGSLSFILSNLGIDKEISIFRSDLTDVVKTSSHTIKIYKDINKTIDGLKAVFYNEDKNISSFINMILHDDVVKLYSKFRYSSFQNILDSYFDNIYLKSLLSVFLGNMGLPASKISAITAIILFREFVFDGGYYVKGGMQSFADAILRTFLKKGGNIIFSKGVKKIKINNKTATGVFLDSNEFIESRYTVSNCDGLNTYFNLIDKNSLNMNFKRLIRSLKSSISAFIVYLGIDKNLRSTDKNKSYSLWYYKNSESINEIFTRWFNGHVNKQFKFVLCSCPSFYDRSLAPNDGETITLITGAPYKNENYWKKNKKRFANNIIEIAEEALGKFSNRIKTSTVATPMTIEEFTSNRKGAMYGWASTYSQNNKARLFRQSGIKRLLTVGHWTLTPFGQGGINGVAQTGFSIGKSIIAKENQKI